MRIHDLQDATSGCLSTCCCHITRLLGLTDPGQGQPSLSQHFRTFMAQSIIEFRDTLIKIDEILTKTDWEHELVSRALTHFVESHSLDQASFFQSKKASFHDKKFKHALRCNIARHLTGESYRLFSLRLADSTLFQWFTDINALSGRKAISKNSFMKLDQLRTITEMETLP